MAQLQIRQIQLRLSTILSTCTPFQCSLLIKDLHLENSYENEEEENHHFLDGKSNEKQQL